MIIEAIGIDLSFQSTQVLKAVDFRLNPGSIHAITGENGAGKSSLAKVLSGIYRPTDGSIRLNNQEAKFGSPRSALAAGIALIHQEPMLFRDLSLAENVFCGSLPRKGWAVDWKQVESKTADIFANLGIQLDPKKPAVGLSIADQQLIELAAAMIHDVKVWIFDETTAPLTPNERNRLFQIIRDLAGKGACVAIVTHHLDEVFEISNEITVLRDGEKVAYLQTNETTKEEVVRWMVGRDVTPTTNPNKTIQNEIAVDVSNLSGPGFSDVSFQIRKGEIFALAGLVGAGRTELTESLFGITQPTEGSFKLHGHSMQMNHPSESINQKIGLVPEDRRQHGLFLDHSIKTNSTLITLKQFLNRFRGISPSKTNQAAEELSKALQIKKSSIDQKASTLSGGNQQKVVLSKWLHEDPQFLILDEPTRGVDIGAKEEVHEIIRTLAAKGIPILMVSSDLTEVLALADRVGVMKKGHLVQILSKEESTQDTIMRWASS